MLSLPPKARLMQTPEELLREEAAVASGTQQGIKEPASQRQRLHVCREHILCSLLQVKGAAVYMGVSDGSLWGAGSTAGLEMGQVIHHNSPQEKVWEGGWVFVWQDRRWVTRQLTGCEEAWASHEWVNVVPTWYSGHGRSQSVGGLWSFLGSATENE